MMRVQAKEPARPTRGDLMLAAATALVALGLMVMLLHPGQPLFQVPDDFVEFWASARLNLSGANPYDGSLMLRFEQQAGWLDQRALMMWNPPWVLPLLMPFGLFDYRLGRVLWLVLQAATVGFCVSWIWRQYGRGARSTMAPWLLALTFLPAPFVLNLGQITPLLLLGVVGFLHFGQRGRWWLAGACGALIALKPHLLYLFWIALLIWSVRQRNCKVVLGAALAMLAGTAAASLANPAVAGQYIYASTHETPLYYMTPTPGASLRVLLGWEISWLQFFPSLLSAAGCTAYCLRRGAEWDWVAKMPGLVCFSVVTAAYGWTYDLVLLLLPLLHLLARWLPELCAGAPVRTRALKPRLALAGYGLLMALYLAFTRANLPDHYCIWLGPLLLTTYLYGLPPAWQMSEILVSRQDAEHVVAAWVRTHSPPSR